jgi:glycyl-tRNA synthetase
VAAYKDWLIRIGIPESLLSLHVHKPEKLAHYAKACTDIVFKYPFGTQELMGIAARGNFDLMQHTKHSGKNLEYFDAKTNDRYLPHVIEPSIGLDRLVLAVLVSAYKNEYVGNELRTVLQLHPSIAPIKASIFPLLSNNDNLIIKSRDVYKGLQQHYACEWDQSGAIGKRYRRADEVGVLFCVTVDHQTLEDDTVTVRHRDTMEQIRIPTKELRAYVARFVDPV